MKPTRERPHLRIYAENVRNGSSALEIREVLLRKAFSQSPIDLTLTIRFTDDPDLSMLARADCFVAAAFDPAIRAAQLQHVRLIHCLSAGVERYMPLTWLPENAAFTNSRGIHAANAGEFGLLALLMLNNHMPEHALNQRSYIWGSRLSSPIAGKTALIYGAGAIGCSIAEKAKLLGLNIIGVRPDAGERPHIDRMIAPSALLDALPQADFVVLTCPLTDETRGAFGSREFSYMKKGAGLVNIARSAVVVPVALEMALNEGTLSGAVIDVFDEEPLSQSSNWWTAKNLFVTPHISGGDPVNSVIKALAIFADNANRLTQGLPMRNRVDRKRGY